MGGRSSGPQPLIKLHDFIRETMHNAQGRKLSSLERHDIANQIAEIVVAGGVRRSLQISLSDLNDEDYDTQKIGRFLSEELWQTTQPYTGEKPTAADFLVEWGVLCKSGSGERGIFNLESAQNQHLPEDIHQRYKEPIRGEIMLRDMEFCNLSEVVVREEDDLDSLLDKVETATWLGVLQSTFTNFPYLRKQWKRIVT